MATLKKTILGRLRGSIGDIVFREKHGKSYASSKPARFRTPNDGASIARRARFRLTLKLSRAVTALVQLKELWSAFIPTGMTVNNFIIRQNYNHVLPDDIKNTAVISPEGGFGVSASSAVVNQSGVQIELNPIGTNAGIDPAVETNLRLFAVVYLTNPVDSSTEPYAFLSVMSGLVPVNLTSPLSFEAEFSNQQALLFNQYQDAKTFLTLITLTDESNIVHHTQTFIA